MSSDQERQAYVHRIWPDPDPRPLDDDALIEAYRPTGPLLRVNFVTSVDGAVEVAGHSAGLQTPADQRVFAMLRMFAQTLLVGAGTIRQEGYGGVRLDDARRAWRTAHGLPPYPRLVIVSQDLDLATGHPALADATPRPAVLTCAASPPQRRAALAEVADVLVFGDAEVDFAAGLAELRTAGDDMILCEGGPHLMGSLTAADVVDELCLTVTPMLAGPGAGRITAGARGLPEPTRLTLAHALCDDDGTLLLRYAR